MPLNVQVPGIRAMPTSTRDLEQLLTSLQVTPDDNSTGTDSLENDAVTNSKLRNSGGLSVIGRSTNTTGDPADITASSADTFLVRRNTALGFGPLVDADIPGTLARDTEVTTAVATEATARDAAIAAHAGLADPHPVYPLAASTEVIGGAWQFSLPIVLPSCTVSGVPSASTFARGIIYVSDESGGPVLAFSDGTNWRRVTDRAVIS